MAVPKKKTSKTKTKVRKTIWKRKAEKLANTLFCTLVPKYIRISKLEDEKRQAEAENKQEDDDEKN
uniref:Ribosomal protein L32 n=1 Tax=Stichococcus bacillaris TaxID=37433 RepID=A0A097KKG3_9CHLO|nr:ribosomal protein L32 [Stichococcus bacillaris]AIT93685.1 ribosomal protein L32 [Stichococcus bacillaris]